MKTDYLKEILLTFSDKPSFFSAKRVERFAVFTSFLSITVFYIITHIQTILPTDLGVLTGIWLGYGGFNTIMAKKDEAPKQVTSITIESTKTE